MSRIELEKIQKRELVPGYFVRFVHSRNMTMAFWEIKAGSALPEHSHPHEQISSLIKGEFQLTVAGKPETMKPGTVIIIPSQAKHSGMALADSEIIDVFYPVREDYL